MNFSKYQKLVRYGTVDAEGIDEGLVYIFPKLDGTNSSVWLKDGEVTAGSRNRELSEDKDNANFYKNIKDNKEIKNYLENNPTHRLYGEYLVPHTIKTYEKDAWNKFYVFDVIEEVNGEQEYLTYEEYQPLLEEYGLDYVPLIKKKKDFSEEELVDLSNEVNYLVKEEEGSGEGIVLKNYDFVNRFGRVVWAKIISEDFGKKKGQVRKRQVRVEGDNVIEKEIVELFCTEAFVEKEFAKIQLKHGGFSGRNIGELLGTVWHEFINEEMFNAVNKLKNPVVDFKVLQHLINNKVKEVKIEFF